MLAARALALRAQAGAPLPECFATVPEPRDARGIRHPLPVVLTLCVAAVLSGETTVIGVGVWAAHAPQDLLAALGARRDTAGRYVAPSAPTVLRLLAALPAKVLARQVGAYLAGRHRRPPAHRTGRRGGAPWPGSAARRRARHSRSTGGPSAARPARTGSPRTCSPRSPTATGPCSPSTRSARRPTRSAASGLVGVEVLDELVQQRLGPGQPEPEGPADGQIVRERLAQRGCHRAPAGQGRASGRRPSRSTFA